MSYLSRHIRRVMWLSVITPSRNRCKLMIMTKTKTFKNIYFKIKKKIIETKIKIDRIYKE